MGISLTPVAGSRLLCPSRTTTTTTTWGRSTNSIGLETGFQRINAHYTDYSLFTIRVIHTYINYTYINNIIRECECVCWWNPSRELLTYLIYYVSAWPHNGFRVTGPRGFTIWYLLWRSTNRVSTNGPHESFILIFYISFVVVRSFHTYRICMFCDGSYKPEHCQWVILRFFWCIFSFTCKINILSGFKVHHKSNDFKPFNSGINRWLCRSRGKNRE